MINERRVKRLRTLIYTTIVILLFLPLILAIVGVRLLFVVGKMDRTMTSVASRVENAAVSLETSVKQAALTIESAKTGSEWAMIPPQMTPVYEPPLESAPSIPFPSSTNESSAPEERFAPDSTPGTTASPLPSQTQSAPSEAVGSDWAPNTGK